MSIFSANIFKRAFGYTDPPGNSQSTTLHPDQVQGPAVHWSYWAYFLIISFFVFKNVYDVQNGTTQTQKALNKKNNVSDAEANLKRENDKKELSTFAAKFVIAAACVLLYLSAYLITQASVSSCLVISQAAPFLMAVLATTCLNWKYHFWKSSKFGIFRVTCVSFFVLAIVAYILAKREGVDPRDTHRWNVYAVGDKYHSDVQADLVNKGTLSKDTLLTVTKTYMHNVNVNPNQDIPERTFFATFSLVEVLGTLVVTTGVLAFLETFLICEAYGSKNGPATAPFDALAVAVFSLLVCWYNPYAVAYGPFHGILTWFAKPVTELVAVCAFFPSVITFLSSIHGVVWSILSGYACYCWQERKAEQRKQEEEEAELRKEQRKKADARESREQRKADARESREHASALREELRMRRIQK